MKKKILSLTLLLGVTLAVTDIRANEAADEGIAEQPGKWEKAGKEVSEATHAVGDATVDSSKKAWKATKEGSAEAWDATKEKSKEWWEQGKAKVHDASAPEPSAEEIEPEAAEKE